MSGNLTRLLRRVTLAILIAAAAPLAFAQNIFKIDIAAQPLAEALRLVGRQTGTNILFESGLVKGMNAPELRAELTVDEAIQRLLAGTKLGAQRMAADTVVVRRAGRETRGKSLTSTAKPGEGSSAADAIVLARVADEAATVRKSGDDVEEMLVEGERERPAPFSTANLDLTRTEDDVLPFTTFTAQDIQLSGARTLQSFLRDRLPQNFTPTISEEASAVGIPFSNVPEVSMRGWGANETVFLLNGRRMGKEYKPGNSDLQPNNGTPDLASIPLGSIERIEILSSAGSAIYGAGVTGGVINIITRRDYTGGSVQVSYDSPLDANAPQRSISANYGLSLAHGFSLRFSGGYRDSEPVKAGDRSGDLILRVRKRRLAINPYEFSSQVFGATPNVTGVDEEGYADYSSSIFGSDAPFYFNSYTTVPDGYRGYPASGGTSAFTQGTVNIDLAEGSAGVNMYAKNSILGAFSNNTSFTFGVDKSFGVHWSLSLDYRRTQGRNEGRPDLSLLFEGMSAQRFLPTTVLPASAPTNPFGVPVSIRLIDPLMDRPEFATRGVNTTEELSSVLKATFGDWRGVVSGAISRNESHGETNVFWEPLGGWLNALTSGAYNPLVDMRVVPAAAPSFYENYILQRNFNGTSNRSRNAMLRISGPALKLPAGPVQLTAGVDWNSDGRGRAPNRTTVFIDTSTGQPRTPVANNPNVSRPQSADSYFTQVNYGGYAEVNAPLVAAAQRKPLINKLELFGSGREGYILTKGHRFDGRPVEYSQRFPTYAWGLSYVMVEGLTLRGSQSIGFLPPSLSFTTPSDPLDPNFVYDSINDPRRLNGTTPEHVELRGTQLALGGNPDLLPETTNSCDFGVILHPRWVRGLRIGFDYHESIRDDAITYGLGAQFFVDNEDALPERLRRAAPDSNPSGVGRVEFVDTRTINLNQIASKSVDFSLSQDIENVFGGRLQLSAAASRMLSFKVQVVAGGPHYEQIRSRDSGRAGRLGNTLAAWNANAQLNWFGQQWGFGWSTRFYDYLLLQISPDDSDFRSLRNLQGSDRAPWKLNHDVNVSYRTARQEHPHGMQWLLSNSSIAFGITNVFDRQPRFWAYDSERGVAPYDSIAGRSFWLNARREF